MTETIEGPLWAARNWSIDAGAGSIHDDETATDLGFRGGTVAGDVHMNQFISVVLETFGNSWFEHGNLSLNFKFATVDLEKVQVFAEKRAPGADQVKVWMEREDGTLVCTGTAGIGDQQRSELRARDLRACDPSELRICKNLYPGLDLGTWEFEVTPEKQFARYDQGVISDAIEAWRKPVLFDGIVACPATYVEYMWRAPTLEGMAPLLPEGIVGLFGAIEIGNVNGPFLLDRPYTVTSEVVAVGHSPQTEFVWHDARARDAGGKEVANFRMMQRFMKASSDLYAD